MTDRYIDNNMVAGVPVGIQTTTALCSINSGTPTIVTSSGGTPFSTVIAGDPFWIDGASTSLVGVYLVVSVGGGGVSVTLDRNAVSGTSASHVTCYHTPKAGTIGSPYPTLQYAVDHAVDADTIYIKANSGYTFDNLDQPEKSTIGSDYCLNIASFKGVIGDGTLARIIGYTATITDGGLVTLDANDQDVNCVHITQANCYIKKIKAGNTDEAGGSNAWIIDGSGADGIIFDSCEGYNARIGYYTDGTTSAKKITLLNCKAYDNSLRGFTANENIETTVIIGGAYYNNNTADVSYGNGLQVEGFTFMRGVLVYGNGSTNGDGLTVESGHTILDGCIIDDNGAYGVRVFRDDGICHIINSIISNHTTLNLSRDGAADGTLLMEYSCSYNSGGTDEHYDLGNNITSDPDYDSDYTPRNSNIIFGGKPDVNDNPTPMGAILKRNLPTAGFGGGFG